MAEFQLTDPRLADILSGRVPWPTEQELAAMSEKPREPKVLGERPARVDVTTTHGADESPGVLGGMGRTTNAPADGSDTLPDGRVIATSSHQPTGATIEMYVPSEDVTEEDANGSVIQIASKGVPMPMAEARRLGLVKDTHRAGPQETKD